MKRVIREFIADKRPLSTSEWKTTVVFHDSEGHRLVVGGFETTACRTCGKVAKVGITFLHDESDMYYTRCVACGEVVREWAIYETDVKNAERD